MRGIWSAVAMVALSAAGLRAGKTPPDIPINLWFDNSLGQGLTSDHLTASANGVIADYIDGLQNVLAIIQGGGNFRFSTQDNTRQATPRSLCVDFGTQYSGALPFGTGSSYQCVNILEAMLSFGTSSAIASLHPGESVQKLVRFQWEDGGYYYRLGYGSDMNANALPDTPPVVVTCVEPHGQPTASCTQWRLTPLADPSGSYESSSTSTVTGTAAFYRARILKNGDGPGELLGYYAMPFTQTFTRK